MDVSAETADGAPAGEHPAPVGARNADALTQLAETGLAAAAGSTGGDRFQVVVHVDAEALLGTEPVEEGTRCALEPEIPISRQTLRRLTCDASLVKVVEDDGTPLSVGRKTRSIPPALRRALRSRDGCCQFPGCANSRHTDAHHIRHWADGGPTDLENVVTLCRHHHRLLHEGGFTMTGAPGALAFTSPSGRRLRPGLSARCPARGTVPSVSAETPVQPWEPMDLGYAVDAVLQFAPVAARDPGGPGERGDPGEPRALAA